MQLLQLAITSLFAALIAADGTSCDSGPSGHGKITCGNDEDALQYLNKFSWVMASTHSRTCFKHSIATIHVSKNDNLVASNSKNDNLLFHFRYE